MVVKIPPSPEERQFTLKKMIARLCEEYELNVTFMTNRRTSDLVTCVLSGERELVLPIPMLVLENLEYEELEVIRSRQEGFDFLLHMVITESRATQVSQSPERRAKLRSDVEITQTES